MCHNENLFGGLEEQHVDAVKGGGGGRAISSRFDLLTPKFAAEMHSDKLNFNIFL